MDLGSYSAVFYLQESNFEAFLFSILENLIKVVNHHHWLMLLIWLFHKIIYCVLKHKSSYLQQIFVTRIILPLLWGIKLCELFKTN